MNSCKRVWPDCVHELSGIQPVVQEVWLDTVGLAHGVGFDETKEEDIMELLDSHAEPLSNKDLLLPDKQQAEDEAKAKQSWSWSHKNFNNKILQSETFKSLDKIIPVYVENDPDWAKLWSL